MLPVTDVLGLTSGKIREISTPIRRNFTDNETNLEKSEPNLEILGGLSSKLEEEKLIQKPIEPIQSKLDDSLLNRTLTPSIDSERTRVEPDYVNTSGNEIGVTKVNLDKENLGSNVIMNDAKNEQVVTGSTLPKKQRRPRERKVPSTSFSRALGFASLGAGLVWGTLQESTKRLVYGTSSEDKQSAYSPFLSEKNAERLALALCRMRGAALKIGQMLSIQDESLIPPPILAALDIVRQGADVMPKSQLDQVLGAELGPNWSSKLINFDYTPLAAASIGQVHKAVTEDGVDVAVKIQYPGVADSIESDIENVKLLLNYTNLIPQGLFLDSAIKVAKEELSRECDYEIEAANQKRFRDFLFQTKGFYVPMVMDNVSSKRVITTELVSGIPIDKVASLSQETRNYVGRKMLELTLMELFVFHFMQTDPNWSNFLFDEATNTINLIDFGAARGYPKSFVDNYLRMVMACANSEREPVLEMSKRLGFLTGTESEIMLDAHVQAAFVVGLPFSKPGLYDFRAANITQSVSNLGATMLRHRKTPPPDEAYSLHRKLSGAFLACIKIGAVVPCRDLLLEVYKNYQFGEDGNDVLTSGSVS